MPEYNVRSTVFLNHRTNWDSVRSAVSSFTWSTILKSADQLVRSTKEDIGIEQQLYEIVRGKHFALNCLS